LPGSEFVGAARLDASSLFAVAVRTGWIKLQINGTRRDRGMVGGEAGGFERQGLILRPRGIGKKGPGVRRSHPQISIVR
jgi:hypothetical protein